MMRQPLVSVIMPSYNHEKFVAKSIQSVLEQSFSDFEFIIADDGSKDGTADVVRSFSDPRIQFMANKENRGAGVVTHELILAAKGKYVALINSDDTWPARKLASQVDFLESHPEYAAHFGRARFIDANDEPIDKSALPFGSIFDQRNRPRGLWLRHFFDKGNCICHPTMVIRRDCYDTLGTYDNRLRQLPDYMMWIEFTKHYAFFIGEDDLVNFRILPGENASGNTRANLLRGINEHYIIAQHFFDNVDRQLMIDAFADRLVHKSIPSESHLEIEKTLQFFQYNQSLGVVYQAIGLNRLYDHLGDPHMSEVLRRDYQIDDRYFHRVMAEYSGFKPLVNMEQFGNWEVFNEFRCRVFRYAKRRLKEYLR